MKRQHTGFWSALVAIAMGMGGELHLPIPSIGYIAMFDLVSYIVALPLIFLYWRKMGKWMRRSLLFSFYWTIAAMLANMLNYYEFRYWLKCVALASSSWAIIATSYYILKDKPLLYLWYLVGAGLGGWISIYYFRNGALESFAAGGIDYLGKIGSSTENLMEKQIYPSIAKGIVLGIVLPLFIFWRKMPVWTVLILTMFSGGWLLLNGGSRSSFGIFCAAAFVGFGTAYMRRVFLALVKSQAVLMILGALAIGVVFGGYKYMAAHGKLGEAEVTKYEREFGEGLSGVLEGRAGFWLAVSNACESWGLGLGCHLRCHSVIANSLACEGVVGFSFWIFFYLQVLWFVSHRVPFTGSNAVFIMIMVLAGCWDVFGSPFGTRHKFFVLMAFIALCRDNALYGVPIVFHEPNSRDLKGVMMVG